MNIKDSLEKVIGQETPIKIIENMLQGGKLHNSMIFRGTSGVGKFYTAFLLAKSLFCEKKRKNLDNCGECKTCLLLDQFSFNNVLFLSISDRLNVIKFYLDILKNKSSRENLSVIYLLKRELSQLISRHKYGFIKPLKTKKVSYPEGQVLNQQQRADLIYEILYLLQEKTSKQTFSEKILADEGFIPKITKLQNSLDRTFISSEGFEKVISWTQGKNKQAKIVVLEDINLMNQVVMSKLLKILEDPPENIYFILLVDKQNEKKMVYVPLVSRSLVLNFNDLKGNLPKILDSQLGVSSEAVGHGEHFFSWDDFLYSYFLPFSDKGFANKLFEPNLKVIEKYNFIKKYNLNLTDICNILSRELVNYVNLNKSLTNPTKPSMKLSQAKIFNIHKVLNQTERLKKNYNISDKNLIFKILISLNKI